MQKEFDLKTVTTPILLHILKQYIRFPKLFLVRCKLTLNGFKKKVDERFPRELVDLAALPLWVYINLKEKLGRDRAFEIMRIAVLTAAVAKQNMLFETLEKGRSFETFKEQEIEINRTGTTKWNTLEIVEQTENRFELSITRCLYFELAEALGVPEATQLICQVDNAVFNSYMPEEVIFHREGIGRRICDGSPACHFVWEKVS